MHIYEVFKSEQGYDQTDRIPNALCSPYAKFEDNRFKIQYFCQWTESTFMQFQNEYRHDRLRDKFGANRSKTVDLHEVKTDRNTYRLMLYSW